MLAEEDDDYLDSDMESQEDEDGDEDVKTEKRHFRSHSRTKRAKR